MEKTLHKTDCKRVFSRYDESCPRCFELKIGAPARQGWGDFKRTMQAQSLAAIRAHDCKKSGCMAICTFGDW